MIGSSVRSCCRTAGEGIPVPFMIRGGICGPTLKPLALRLGLPVLAGDGLEGVVKRQSFATRRKELASSGSKYMYGETIQLKNMRKGIAGDWKNHFNPELEKLAEGYFGETMRRMGYG